jgi:hypothetical protein
MNPKTSEAMKESIDCDYYEEVAKGHFRAFSVFPFNAKAR